ncbi:MAG: EF-hand domain-containing protein [Verrucomicrobia bacterium]|nr:EF-hand domain-containing protein [Verrucomicrobiota bacterium]
MKKILSTLLIAAAVCGLVVTPASAAKKKKNDAADVGTLIKKYDKNNDGKLDADEIAAIEKDPALMKQFDLNGNGKIDEDEKAALESALKNAAEPKKKKKNQ